MAAYEMYNYPLVVPFWGHIWSKRFAIGIIVRHELTQLRNLQGKIDGMNG